MLRRLIALLPLALALLTPAGARAAEAPVSAPADRPAQRRPASAADAPAASVDPDDPPLWTDRPQPLTPADERPVSQPHNRPTLAWLLTQLVPSPGLWFGPGHVFDATRADGELPPGQAPRGLVTHRSAPRMSLSWQVTPLLYSFGVNRRVSPWRFLVVDPFARNAGSVELHFSPEWVPAGPESHLFFRTGVRATLPLHQHGEYVALSFGTSYARYEGRGGVIYEGGLSLLFGTVGVMLSHSPSFPELRYGVRLNLRYF